MQLVFGPEFLNMDSQWGLVDINFSLVSVDAPAWKQAGASDVKSL
jgi:hypothetical protein